MTAYSFNLYKSPDGPITVFNDYPFLAVKENKMIKSCKLLIKLAEDLDDKIFIDLITSEFRISKITSYGDGEVQIFGCEKFNMADENVLNIKYNIKNVPIISTNYLYLCIGKISSIHPKPPEVWEWTKIGEGKLVLNLADYSPNTISTTHVF